MIDTRRIMFDEDEVLAAVRQFYVRSRKTFPVGTVEHIVIVDEPECTFRCEVRKNNFKENVEVGGAALAAALIAYCMSRRIPLPAKAEKHLDLVRGQIALTTRTVVNSGQFKPSNKPAHAVGA